MTELLLKYPQSKLLSLSFLQIYIFTQYYLNQVSLSLEKFKSGMQSNTQITHYAAIYK